MSYLELDTVGKLGGIARRGQRHRLNVLTVAINLIRLYAFLAGIKTAKTRTSRFAALTPAKLAG